MPPSLKGGTHHTTYTVNMIPLQTPPPEFTLPNSQGQREGALSTRPKRLSGTGAGRLRVQITSGSQM